MTGKTHLPFLTRTWVAAAHMWNRSIGMGATGHRLTDPCLTPPLDGRTTVGCSGHVELRRELGPIRSGFVRKPWCNCSGLSLPSSFYNQSSAHQVTDVSCGL